MQPASRLLQRVMARGAGRPHPRLCGRLRRRCGLPDVRSEAGKPVVREGLRTVDDNTQESEGVHPGSRVSF